MNDEQPPRHGRPGRKSDRPTGNARRDGNRARPGAGGKGPRKPDRDRSSAGDGGRDGAKRTGGGGRGGGAQGGNRYGQRGGDKRAHGKPSNRGGGRRDGGARPERKGGMAASGILSRRLALTILEAVMRDQISLDVAMQRAFADDRYAGLEARDRAFARLLVMTVLRRHANLQAVVDTFLDKPLSADAARIRILLLAGTAELLLLGVAPHATLSTVVELTRLSAKTRHFDRLVNAILRRVSERGQKVYAENSAITANFPDWMLAGWRQTYGAEIADRIAETSLGEAALDLTVKDDAGAWAERLGATLLATGSLRLTGGGRVEELAGFDEGAWWVQDAAAALPARLLGAGPDSRVLDLCAAPGGKTAQLCATGADVTAVDVSMTRLDRLRENLGRLGYFAHTIAADAVTWRDVEPFDAILIDAPCTATGTIRRHPDILHLKREDDLARLADTQLRLLRNAASLLKVGGTLVYCTCSLEPGEGEGRIAEFLANPGAQRRSFARRPIDAAEIGAQSDWITPAGDLRTLPFHLANDDPALAGIDGFYAARLTRTA